MLPGIASRPGLNAGGGELTLEFIGHGTSISGDCRAGDLLVIGRYNGRSSAHLPSGWTGVYNVFKTHQLDYQYSLGFKIADGSEAGTNPGGGNSGYKVLRPKNRRISTVTIASKSARGNNSSFGRTVTGNPEKLILFTAQTGDNDGYRTTTFSLDGVSTPHSILRMGYRSDGALCHYVHTPGDLENPSNPLPGYYYRSNKGISAIVAAALEIE